MKKPGMKRYYGLLTVGFTLAASVFITPFQLSAEETAPPFKFHKPASKWAKGDFVIVRAGSNRYSNHHLGPTGLWGIPFGQNICVQRVTPGSPADGKVLPYDVIYGANGKEFSAGRDVRYYLANAITEAETKKAGGKLTLHIRRNGKLIRVPIQLEVMGSFSATTPWDCEKSKKIVANAEAYLLKGLRPEKGLPNNGKYMYDPFHDSVLFLMASGNPKLQGLVRRHIRNVLNDLDAKLRSHKGWYQCYVAMLLGEYYHLTGDPTVQSSLAAVCNGSGRTDFSWPPQEESRYGLHPHMQMPSTMGKILANEAGLLTSKKQLLFDLKYLNVRRAEYGSVKYCGYASMPLSGRQSQAPKEITAEQKTTGTYSSMNGKLGAAAALFSLVDGHEKSVEACATRCVYGFNQTRWGHGGVWFNGFWTPIGAHHAGLKKCQTFMKGQQWWRELYRDHTGAMWQTGNAKGKSDTFGTGFAIHRVMHKRRLRMFGAPRSYFCPNPPAYMKPALAAHRNRDYARAEQLILKLIADGKVPASAKDRANHFLNSVQTLKRSVEYDLTFTEKLLKKENYALADVELPQLQMVVSPGNSRLKAIVRALESTKAKAQIASARPAKAGGGKGSIRRACEAMARAFQKDLASIVTLVKDPAKHVGPKIGRSYTKYPTYSENESSRWRVKRISTLKDTPNGWEQPTFDDSKWKESVLPVKTHGKRDKGPQPVLLRTRFAIKDVSAFKSLRIRMNASRKNHGSNFTSNLTFYLNGEVVAVGASEQFTSVAFHLGPRSLALLKRGSNTLAISAYRIGNTSFTARLEGLLKDPAEQAENSQGQKEQKKGGEKTSKARPRATSAAKQAHQEVEFMLEHLKKVQPKVRIGSKVFPGMKVHNYLASAYEKHKSKVTSSDIFLNKIASKTRKGQVYYVLDDKGKKTTLKSWLAKSLVRMKEGSG